MKNLYLLLLAILFLIGCSKGSDPSPTNPGTSMYFPASSGTWETTSTTDLGWKTSAIADLKNFLAQKNTKSFMILVNGKIAMEEYLTDRLRLQNGNGTAQAKH